MVLRNVGYGSWPGKELFKLSKIQQPGRQNLLIKPKILNPGLYPLDQARQVDQIKTYKGIILYIDTQSVDQPMGQQVIVQDRKHFDQTPDIAGYQCMMP